MNNMNPKHWWSNPDNAEKWIRRCGFYYQGDNPTLEYVVSRIPDRFATMLEVGAGNGMFIGRLSQMYPYKGCSSIDINPKLSEYVNTKYPSVEAHVGDLTCLPFIDNNFTFIFTHQVLQHIQPEEIKQAIEELKRVASREVWLFEGWGNTPDVMHGNMRHKADGGTWYWDISKLTDCYEVEYIKESLNKKGEGGVRLYKIKV